MNESPRAERVRAVDPQDDPLSEPAQKHGPPPEPDPIKDPGQQIRDEPEPLRHYDPEIAGSLRDQQRNQNDLYRKKADH
jgi:hypothetical protein